MAETEPEVAAAVPAVEAVVEAEKEDTSAQDMDVEAQAADDTEENGGSKRPREEENEVEKEDATKKLKVDKSVEEERFENLDGSKTVDEEKKDVSGPISVGPKNFGSSVEVFNYFYKLLHSWSPNLNLNKVSCFMYFLQYCSKTVVSIAKWITNLDVKCSECHCTIVLT